MVFARMASHTSKVLRAQSRHSRWRGWEAYLYSKIPSAGCEQTTLALLQSYLSRSTVLCERNVILALTARTGRPVPQRRSGSDGSRSFN